MFCGVSKSGSPAARPMTSLPSAFKVSARLFIAMVGEGLIRDIRSAIKPMGHTVNGSGFRECVRLAAVLLRRNIGGELGLPRARSRVRPTRHDFPGTKVVIKSQAFTQYPKDAI